MTLAVLRSPLARDAAVAAAMFAIGLLLHAATPELRVVWWAGPPPATATTVAVLALGCAGIVARRAAPLAALGIATATLLAGPFALGVSALGTIIVFTDALYCAVLHTSRVASRAVCMVSGAIVLALTIEGLVSGGGSGGLRAIVNLMLLAVPVLWALEVRRHREVAELARARAAQASRMAEMDRASAVAEERARMARDLHDIVAGQLSAIALQSEAALNDPALRDRVLAGVRDASVSALAEMRTMIGLLRAEPDTDPRTSPARLDQLDALLGSARSWGLRVDVHDDRPDAPAVPAAVELAAYRIVQEGLTNVAKHAPGADVAVSLSHDGDRLDVRVDNGPPTVRIAADAPAPPGTGLDGLAERAAAVGGTVRAGPDGDGWSLRASLPLAGERGRPEADGAAVRLA